MEKEKEIILNENKSMKKKSVLKEKENISKKNKDFVFHVSSSKIDNDICIMKKNIYYLGSTLSQCAFNHNILESMFRKKQISHAHAQTLRHSYALHAHSHTIICMLECTNVHIAAAKAI